MNVNHDTNEAPDLIKLFQEGRYNELIPKLKSLIGKYPQSVFILNLLGATNIKLGDYANAIKYYETATTLDPKNFEIYNNNGVAHKNLGDYTAAITSYKKCLALNPNHFSAHNNIGLAYQYLQDWKLSRQHFAKAHQIDPQKVEPLVNLGNLMLQQSRVAEGIEYFNMALRLDSNSIPANIGLGMCIKNAVFHAPNPEILSRIGRLLDLKTLVRPAYICRAAISLLKLDPKLAHVLNNITSEIDTENFEVTIETLIQYPVLTKLKQSCPIPDIEIEFLFSQLRRHILLNINEMRRTPALLEFQSALACQCFINEYVYGLDPEQDFALQNLEAKLEKQNLTNTTNFESELLCLASYKSLLEYQWYKPKKEYKSKFLAKIHKIQIEQPLIEQSIQKEIVSLTGIENLISAKVREQYEVNPYPRWVNLGLLPSPISVQAMSKLYNLRINKSKTLESAPLEILIAGCGTGQHPIETARKFFNCHVTAVDLSVASLAFAKRKAEELNVKNISFFQADILELGQFDKSFDIIESVGVLHHLDQPLMGWETLLKSLKDNGLMRIGLYSHYARKHITNIRKELIDPNCGASIEQIRCHRNRICGSSEPDHIKVRNSSDFYSTSAIRDLLFHVQEHQFTLPEIKQNLTSLGLNFCGFEAPNLIEGFRINYREPMALYDLDCWHDYEVDNPDSFSNMYQFWCQKIMVEKQSDK